MARARRVPAQGHALRVTRPAALARCLRPKERKRVGLCGFHAP
ncbi:hypothetical protein RAA17_13080 [Komagataeibacter rhaeticus]|nr:hypothetical protein [Komagataeibacter rhaeticus]